MSVIYTLIMVMTFTGNGLVGQSNMEIQGFQSLEQCELALNSYRRSANESNEIVEFGGICIETTGA